MSNSDAISAELALLGGLMLCPSYREHTGALEASHFYDPVLGRLFAEITRRIDAGIVADAITLRPWLEADPAAKEVPNLLMLALAEAAPTGSQVAAYAEQIRDTFSRRAAAAILSMALKRLESEEDLLCVLAESEAALRDLGPAEQSARSLPALGGAFLAVIDRAAASTGLPSLDERLGGLSRGDLYILAGRPSMGKTTLAAQIARNVASRGRAVHFASLEMSGEQLARRAISAASYLSEYGAERVPYFKLRNGAANISRPLLEGLAAALPEMFEVDDRPAQSLVQLEQSARATRRKHKRLDLIVVDYLQLMRSFRKDGRVHEVTEISQGLKAIAKRLNVPVLALCQLSRGVEGRDNKRPTLSDLRDSGAIEQDADVVLACYREAYYLERGEPSGEDIDAFRKWQAALERVKLDLEIITLKQRQGEIGTDMLVAHLAFDTIRDRRVA